MNKTDIKALSNEGLLKAYSTAVGNTVKEENFRKRGITKKTAEEVDNIEMELLKRLKGAES